MISEYEWAKLGNETPNELKPIVRMCEKYVARKNRLLMISPFITAVNIADIQSMVIRIIENYHYLIKKKCGNDEKRIKEFREEIKLLEGELDRKNNYIEELLSKIERLSNGKKL